MRSQVITRDGIPLNVPSRDRCWEFKIIYTCGHAAKTKGSGTVKDKVIHVKQGDHRGSCWLRHCVRAYETHVLPEQCAHCELADARFAGAYL
jgi:hypothetical protein